MLGKILRGVALGMAVYGVTWAAALHSRRAGTVAFLAVLAVIFLALVWLPRAAHRAFRAGRFTRARWLYTALRWLRISRDARASVTVSLAACALGQGDWERALAVLGRLDPDRLGDAVRAAWLNNRGYALARSGRDLGRALELADQSLVLRPDVAGFRHTRAIALLGLGRTDDAIAELDRMWTTMPEKQRELLEAERCFDLATAWTAKGEADYASDYYERSLKAAPESIWGQRAAAKLAVAMPRGVELGGL